MVKQSSLQQLLLPFPSILPQIGRLLYSQQTSILVRFRRLSAGKTFTTNATTTISAKMATESYAFGPYKIHSDEVFYTTPLSYAFVNLRPVVPDVLVCPKREVKRFADLTAEETTDLWAAAHRIAAPLENYHKASSLTFTIQDGPQAGQSVAHVHVHILPRKGGDFENNDDIYEAIDGEEKELKKKLNLDEERKDRNREEMAREAEEYRKLIL